jgi:hypothetical protein
MGNCSNQVVKWKLMRKEKYGSIESSTKIMLMLAQKKYESRSSTRDKSKDVYN